MPSPFQKVLLIGASTGIGKGMAEKLIQEGSYVIVTSRSEGGLKKLVDELGGTKSSYMAMDVSDLNSIPNFVEKVFKEHPDIDCVWLNAGVQYPCNILSGSMDMSKVASEVAINYTGQVALSQAVLPHVKDRKSALVYTSTALAYLPFPMVSTYSSSKAAMHFYTLCLREQLKRAGSQCRVMELYPPVVQTELHGPGGREMGMPLKEFVEQAWPGIRDGHEHWVVGKSIAPEGFFEDVETARVNALTKALDNFAASH